MKTSIYSLLVLLSSQAAEAHPVEGLHTHLASDPSLPVHPAMVLAGVLTCWAVYAVVVEKIAARRMGA
ncbi:MAG: hypothetical protein ACR652_16405 [Methylocystis sp.]|uniref:hypothetical protein n=1 Tax=Methylocystis sp. TaxID=1911079 RepID=UPI003DA4900E